MQKKIFYLYKTPRENIYKSWELKKGPDTILYGSNRLRELGYKVFFSDISFSNLNPIKWLFYPVPVFFKIKSGIGFKLDQAITFLPIFNRYDVIVSTIDSAGLPVLMLKKMNLISTPVVYISIDFAFRLEENSTKWPYSWYKNLLGEADLIVCYSKEEQEILSKYNNTHFIPIGTDIDYYKIKSAKSIRNKKTRILAFGRDNNRDYKTFIESIKDMNIDGIIVASPDNLKNLKIPRNTKVYFDLEAKKLKNLIISSDIVVIPVKNTKRASGQLSLLDALACKKPTIIADIPGLVNVYKLTSGKNCILYKAQDAKSLKASLEALTSGKNTMKNIAGGGYKTASQYSTKRFASELSKIINKL